MYASKGLRRSDVKLKDLVAQAAVPLRVEERFPLRWTS